MAYSDLKLNFGRDVLVIPGSVLNDCEADAVQLRVLLWLASDLSLSEKPMQLARLAGCDAKCAKAAVEYWLNRGVLAGENAVPVMATPKTEEPKKAAPAARTLLQRADELPSYTSTELAELLEKRASVRVLVDEAQRIIGKMFNMSEVNILVTMLDYLNMSEECVLMLLAHCRRIGKTSMRSIEKYALRLANDDITTAERMEEELRTLEALHSFEGEIRTLFGLKSRSLTVKESKMLRAWSSFGYDIEIVRRAYELTVNATGEASLPYADSILCRWHEEGLKNAAEIDAVIAEQARERAQAKGAKKSRTPEAPIGFGNSFNTDDFFEDALRRSFRETGVDASDSSKS